MNNSQNKALCILQQHTYNNIKYKIIVKSKDFYNNNKNKNN